MRPMCTMDKNCKSKTRSNMWSVTKSCTMQLPKPPMKQSTYKFNQDDKNCQSTKSVNSLCDGKNCQSPQCVHMQAAMNK